MSNPPSAPIWKSDPLLARPTARAPQFVRMAWDENASQDFGPWRLQDKPDPTQSQSAAPHDFTPHEAPQADTGHEDASALPAQPGANHAQAPGHEDPQTAQPAHDSGAQAMAGESPDPAGAAPAQGYNEHHLKVARQQGYVQGIKDGVAKTLSDLEVEREKEREALRALMIELRALAQDPERYFEPVRRLSLHIAEQLVRGELSVSGQAIERLVQSALADLGAHDKPAVVSLHPDDLQRLQSMLGEAAPQLRLEADADLLPGSVRVRSNDTEIQDFIAHRLEPLARRLLRQPEAWMGQSSLANKVSVQEMPDKLPEPPWRHRPRDVQDAQEKTSSTLAAQEVVHDTPSEDGDAGQHPALAAAPTDAPVDAPVDVSADAPVDALDDGPPVQAERAPEAQLYESLQNAPADDVLDAEPTQPKRRRAPAKAKPATSPAPSPSDDGLKEDEQP